MHLAMELQDGNVLIIQKCSEHTVASTELNRSIAATSPAERERERERETEREKKQNKTRTTESSTKNDKLRKCSAYQGLALGIFTSSSQLCA